MYHCCPLNTIKKPRILSPRLLVVLLCLVVRCLLLGVGDECFVAAGELDFSTILPISICPCFRYQASSIFIDVVFDELLGWGKRKECKSVAGFCHLCILPSAGLFVETLPFVGSAYWLFEVYGVLFHVVVGIWVLFPEVFDSLDNVL